MTKIFDENDQELPLYEGEPDDVPRAKNGRQDELEDDDGSE